MGCVHVIQPWSTEGIQLWAGDVHRPAQSRRSGNRMGLVPSGILACWYVCP